MSALAKLGLWRDPFDRAPTSQVLVAFSELDFQIGERMPIIVLFGPAGSGKTFLLNSIKDDRRARGLSVRLMDGGDIPDERLDYVPDLLLIDDADCVTEATLERLLHRHRKRPASIVLAVGSAPRGHLVGRDGIALIELKPLTTAEARAFVKEQASAAGRPDLFSADALDAIAEASLGSQRLLRAIGRGALYRAAHDGAAQVGEDHAQNSIALKLIARRPRLAEAPRHGALEIINGSAAPDIFNRASNHGELIVAPATNRRAPSPFGVPVDVRSATRRLRAPAKLTAAIALGVGLFAAMLLGSSAGEPQSAPSSLRRSVAPDWERVAQATLPPPIILAALNPAPLQAMSIAAEQPPARAASNVAAQTRNQPQNANAVPPRQSPQNAHLPKQIVPQALAVESQERTADTQVPPAPPSPPPPPAPTAFDRYMTSEQMTLALSDLSVRAGLNRNREYPAFRACVFGQVPTEMAPSVLFWTVATACLK